MHLDYIPFCVAHHSICSTNSREISFTVMLANYHYRDTNYVSIRTPATLQHKRIIDICARDDNKCKK